MQISPPMVEYIAMKRGYINLSDLHHMDTAARLAACRVGEKVNAEPESLDGWNDALSYLMGEPPAKSQEEARSRLIEKLRAA